MDIILSLEPFQDAFNALGCAEHAFRLFCAVSNTHPMVFHHITADASMYAVDPDIVYPSRRKNRRDLSWRRRLALIEQRFGHLTPAIIHDTHAAMRQADADLQRPIPYDSGALPAFFCGAPVAAHLRILQRINDLMTIGFYGDGYLDNVDRVVEAYQVQRVFWAWNYVDQNPHSDTTAAWWALVEAGAIETAVDLVNARRG